MSFLFRYLRFHDIIGGIHVPVDDGVDKLNRKYTLLVFLFLALPIFTKQYIGDPIECFAPVYFAEHQSRYINSYCWTQSTYYMVPVGDPEDDGDQQEPPDRIMPDEVDYFIGFETVTHIGNERLRRVRVSYYQWAPLILLVQGLCFYIPFLIWNSCANNAGVKLRRLLKKASDIASLPPGCQQREALLAEFVDQFHTLVTGEAGWCADLQCGGASGGSSGGPGGHASSPGSGSSGSSQASAQSGGPQQPVVGSQGARSHRQAGNQNQHEDATGDGRGNHARSHASGPGGHAHSQQPTGCCLVGIPIIGSLLACCLKPCSSFGLVGPSKYLCLLYLAVKSAYVFNVGLQFFLLGQFLGRGYLKHGLELINRLIVNGDWWASPRFPLSTLCQVRADMSGGLRSYTCQCVLPINVFNEKIFSVVWFYMAFLMPLNVLSLLFWIYRTFETNRLSYIRLCLWRTRLVELNQIHRTVRRLSQSYLGWDGVFLLRLIEHNHGSIMATLIMSRLWEFYANQMKLQEDANQMALANNAQHTLSNTTTAISSQHQLLAAAAAAAAAAANQQQPPSIGGPPQGGLHHGPAGHAHPPHGHSHVHAHGPPPLMPSQAPHPGGGGGGVGGAGHFGPNQHSHAHPAHSHAHTASGHAHGHGQGGANFGVPPQPPMAPMVAHGPHAHHSGQISQAPGHHPLHAANTHHAHHGPTHANVSGPSFGASSGTMSANLLAQLQHQHHQHQQQQHAQATGQATVGVNSVSAGQSHATGASSNQQPASGNVAAAVAALAAAAAANSTTSGSTPGQQQQQQQPQQQQQTSSNAGPSNQGATNNNNTNNNTNTSTSNQPTTASAGALPWAPTAGSSAASSNLSSAANNSASSATNAGISLHSLMQQAAVAAGQAGSSGGVALGLNGAAQQAVPGSQALAAIQASAGAASSGNAVASAQQHQQAAPLAAAPTSGQAASGSTQANNASAATNQTTTSFINSASGPPLPPPPPAHVVAAVAAASSGGAATGAVAPSSGASQALSNGGGPLTATAAATLRSPPQMAAAGNQPAPPPHTNPVLFNLKSSSIQAAGAQSGVSNGGTNLNARYAPHTIKR